MIFTYKNQLNINIAKKIILYNRGEKIINQISFLIRLLKMISDSVVYQSLNQTDSYPFIIVETTTEPMLIKKNFGNDLLYAEFDNIGTQLNIVNMIDFIIDIFGERRDMFIKKIDIYLSKDISIPAYENDKIVYDESYALQMIKKK